MKLYHNQESWQIPGKQDRKAERVDVPSSPADLAAWLNARHVQPVADFYLREEIALQRATDEAAERRIHDDPLGLELEAAGNPNRCAKCKSILSATIAGADASAFSREINAIAEWTDRAPDWAIERLAEILNDRARARGQGRTN